MIYSHLFSPKPNKDYKRLFKYFATNFPQQKIVNLWRKKSRLESRLDNDFRVERIKLIHRVTNLKQKFVLGLVIISSKVAEHFLYKHVLPTFHRDEEKHLGHFASFLFFALFFKRIVCFGTRQRKVVKWNRKKEEIKEHLSYFFYTY